MANKEVFIDLKNRILSLSKEDKLLRVIATTTRARMLNRVFALGLLADGKAPKAYSRKPMYASLKLSSKLKGDGKYSPKSTFKNGKKRKSEYLPGGYKMLKDKLGRTNRFDFTGQLKKAFIFEKNNNGEWVIGFAGTSRYNPVTKEGVTMTHGELVGYLEEKYGIIFSLTKEEEAKIDEVAQLELDRLFK